MNSLDVASLAFFFCDSMNIVNTIPFARVPMIPMLMAQYSNIIGSILFPFTPGGDSDLLEDIEMLKLSILLESLSGLVG